MAPDEVRERLVSAVEELAAREAPAAVTMRAIAEEAGVSPSHAYHYFDCKETLFSTALDSMAARIAAGVPDEGEPAATVRGLWAQLEENPAFPRILAWWILEGRDPTAAMSGHPLVQGVALRANREGHPDPATLAGTVALLGLTGAFWVPAINEVLGRDPNDPTLADALLELLRAQTSRTP